MEGYTTMGGLVAPFAFHAISSALGMQLLTAAAKRRDATKEESAPLAGAAA